MKLSCSSGIQQSWSCKGRNCANCWALSAAACGGNWLFSGAATSGMVEAAYYSVDIKTPTSYMAPITECLHSYRAHATLATLPGRSLQKPETTSLTIKIHMHKRGRDRKERVALLSSEDQNSKIARWANHSISTLPTNSLTSVVNSLRHLWLEEFDNEGLRATDTTSNASLKKEGPACPFPNEEAIQRILKTL